MKTLLDEMKEQADCFNYISKDGKLCYRTCGDLMWYLLKCNKYGLKVDRNNDYGYIAKGNGFELEFCENDIIYAVNIV